MFASLTRSVIGAHSDQTRVAGSWEQPAADIAAPMPSLLAFVVLIPPAQRAQNLALNDRISLTIDHDTSDPIAITGLSMAAHAEAVGDPAEVAKVLNLMPAEYPAFPMPKPEKMRISRVTPRVISVLH